MNSLAFAPFLPRLLPSILALLLAAPRARCVTVEDFYSYGREAGDRASPRTDDGYSQALNLQTRFPFFDKNREVVHVSVHVPCECGAAVSATVCALLQSLSFHVIINHTLCNLKLIMLC